MLDAKGDSLGDVLVCNFVVLLSFSVLLFGE
jgi:hypothetical protein